MVHSMVQIEERRQRFELTAAQVLWELQALQRVAIDLQSKSGRREQRKQNGTKTETKAAKQTKAFEQQIQFVLNDRAFGARETRQCTNDEQRFIIIKRQTRKQIRDVTHKRQF